MWPLSVVHPTVHRDQWCTGYFKQWPVSIFASFTDHIVMFEQFQMARNLQRVLASHVRQMTSVPVSLGRFVSTKSGVLASILRCLSTTDAVSIKKKSSSVANIVDISTNPTPSCLFSFLSSTWPKRLQTTDYKLQITNYRLQTTDYRLLHIYFSLLQLSLLNRGTKHSDTLVKSMWTKKKSTTLTAILTELADLCMLFILPLPSTA